MFWNFIKTAWRGLRRHKRFAIINVIGLALGIGVALLILGYVRYERSYDQFYTDSDRIYRLVHNDYSKGTPLAVTPVPVAEKLASDLPDVEAATRIWVMSTTGRWMGTTSVRVGYQDQFFIEKRVIFADSNFFDIFDMPLLKGDPVTALKRPRTVVITASTARKYFGRGDPLGRTLTTDAYGNFEVTGVVADVPANSHFQFDLLPSFVTLPASQGGGWTGNQLYAYVRLREHADVQHTIDQLPALLRTYLAPQVEQRFGVSYDDYVAAGRGYMFTLQALTDIHLDSNLQYEIQPNGSRQVVYIFMTVALMVLLLASVNFTNLSTAQALRRAREVGVRKALGARRQQLMGRFWAEACMVTVLAAGLAMGAVALVQPWLSQSMGHPLLVFSEPTVLLGLGAIVLFVALLAGAYPAFVLSRMQPVLALKGKAGSLGSSVYLRNGLVVFQFVVSVVLIVSTLVMQTQRQYMQNKALGFDKEHVIMIERGTVLGGQRGAFRQKALQHPGVKHVTTSGSVPGRSHGLGSFYKEGEGELQRKNMHFIVVDTQYVETLGLDVLEGRNFVSGLASDSTAVLLNETAARQLGLDDPIGKRIRMWTPSVYTVIGIVRDYHFASLHDAMKPLVMLNTNAPIGFTMAQVLSIRIAGDQREAALAHLEGTWKQFVEAEPFVYTFLDSEWAALYASEEREARLFFGFTVLALGIACLGLFGLVHVIAEQKTKEVGIRKVLGASSSSLVLLLSKDFLRLVVGAVLVGIPLAYLAMEHWLSDFAYRVPMEWTVFMYAGGLTLVVALSTLIIQTIKTARRDPVQALRYE